MRRLSKLVFLVCLSWLIEIASSEDEPNVIFILVDDQGYHDLGCFGATEVKTPRIDGLAANGVRFTDY